MFVHILKCFNEAESQKKKKNEINDKLQQIKMYK